MSLGSWYDEITGAFSLNTLSKKYVFMDVNKINCVFMRWGNKKYDQDDDDDDEEEEEEEVKSTHFII